MRRVLFVAVAVLFTACSASGGDRDIEIQPVSELAVERIGCNLLPLRPYFLSDDTVRSGFFSEDCLCRSNPVLVCQNTDVWHLSMNGLEVEIEERVHVFDQNDACFQISGMIQAGDNSIEIASGGKHGQMFLAGDFSVFRNNNAELYAAPAASLNLGNVVSQGVPFIHGYMSYSRLYELSDNARKCLLRIPCWKGSLCEVYANGKKITAVKKKHSSLNVSFFPRPGVNCIELRVFGFPFSSFDESTKEYGLYDEFTITKY